MLEGDMKGIIEKAVAESVRVKDVFFRENAELIVDVSKVIAGAFEAGNKVLLFGNGGSSTDASHIAAEFVNRFLMERRPLPAVALNTDMAVVTAISNDYGFSDVFAKQIRALGREGDVVIGISTSGASENVLNAMEAAREKRLVPVAFTGEKGTDFASRADYSFIVSSASTPRIQETHITLGHVICQLVEEILFGRPE